MPKIKRGELVCIKVYLDEPEFAEIASLSAKAGKRGLGLKLRVLKPHGLAGETIPNTKGISKFLKFAALDWKEHEAERLTEAAKIKEEEKALAERKAKLGLT